MPHWLGDASYVTRLSRDDSPHDRPDSGIGAQLTGQVRVNVSFRPSPPPPAAPVKPEAQGMPAPLCFVESGIYPRPSGGGAMSRPSGSVEACRQDVRTVGSWTNLGTSRHEPCSRCGEQGCLRTPSVKRVGRPLTGSGGQVVVKVTYK